MPLELAHMTWLIVFAQDAEIDRILKAFKLDAWVSLGTLLAPATLTMPSSIAMPS